jgi:hypothetical protein
MYRPFTALVFEHDRFCFLVTTTCFSPSKFVLLDSINALLAYQLGYHYAVSSVLKMLLLLTQRCCRLNNIAARILLLPSHYFISLSGSNDDLVVAPISS